MVSVVRAMCVEDYKRVRGPFQGSVWCTKLVVTTKRTRLKKVALAIVTKLCTATHPCYTKRVHDRPLPNQIPGHESDLPVS